MVVLNTFIILALIGFVACENVSFKSCPGYAGNCVIHAVRINPCPEATNDEPCKIKRGKSANIEFDYTADFNADSMEGRVYWAATEVDLPLMGMDTDACKFTKCPVVKDKKQTYQISLPIARKFPPNVYDIKWRLTGQGDQECCFLTKIQLPR